MTMKNYSKPEDEKSDDVKEMIISTRIGKYLKTHRWKSFNDNKYLTNMFMSYMMMEWEN